MLKPPLGFTLVQENPWTLVAIDPNHRKAMDPLCYLVEEDPGEEDRWKKE